jgi:DNA-directed RNA polymerase specialized sigma24 family protein
MNAPGSVTIWLDKLKEGEREEAVTQLWNRYFEKLVTRARDHLRGRRVAVDGEDIALVAFDRFVRAVAAGRFPQLNTRDDLWQVLLVLTARISTNEARNESRKKRGGGRIFQSISPPSDSSGSVLPVVSSEPDPAEARALAEGVEKMLTSLENPLLTQVAILALEGYTNKEIAENIHRVVSTVERKLSTIRDIWAKKGFL